jgi:hypothetical protein
MWMYGIKESALRAAVTIYAITLARQHLQAFSVPDVGTVIHVQTLGALALPSVAAIITLSDRLGIKGVMAVSGSCVGILALLNLAARNWSVDFLFLQPECRLLISVLPIAGVLFAQHHTAQQWNGRYSIILFIISILIALLIPGQSVNTFFFDEAHGSWETTKTTYNPNDFGRNVNYTYSLIYRHAGRLFKEVATIESETDQLDANDALMIKMPTSPLSPEFIEKITRWVYQGGRLIVVADHTDLYNTTQILTPLVTKFGYKIGSEAVFDSSGMPNDVASPLTDLIIGRLDSGKRTVWQTGTSVVSLPINAVELATFGLSFTEPADYSRQNRFGFFYPDKALPFQIHSSVVASSFGKGAVVLVLDSTPWSNFSLFKQPFLAHFNALANIIQHPLLLALAGWSGAALLVLALVLAFWARPITLALSCVVLGIAGCAHVRLGMLAAEPIVYDRDYSIRVMLGDGARTEFLSQLVKPGERNFSRILSSAQKYGIKPLAEFPGESLSIQLENDVLLIEPDGEQLPSAEQIFKHLESSRDLTILFGPEAIREPIIQEWLSSLKLIPTQTKGLALAEDLRPGGIMARRGVSLMRDLRTIIVPDPSSMLKAQQSEAIAQSFTVRPTLFPPRSGLLTLSFSADQFSDDAVGEVWDGSQPSEISRLREAQFAAILSSDAYPRPVSSELSLAENGIAKGLNAYVMLADGTQMLAGELKTLEAPAPSFPSLSENPNEYLYLLRARAIALVRSTCPKPRVPCPVHLIGPDLVEWIVTWTAAEDGGIAALELLHERRFSGLGTTWNVVFGNE